MHNTNIKKNLGVTDEKVGENTEVLHKKRSEIHDYRNNKNVLIPWSGSAGSVVIE